MIKRNILAIFIAISGLYLSTPTLAWLESGGERSEAINLQPNVQNGMNVYKVCSKCHLPDGWGKSDGTIPMIAGQHRTVLIKQLADIREGNRDNPMMYPYATAQAIGGAQALSDVTAYIAKLPMNPGPGLEPGIDLEHGKKLYLDNCVKCHGGNGEGNADKFYPRIHGQHYNYLLRQFEWIFDGFRRNANPDMTKQIKNFHERDMKAVVNYVSRLKPPAKLVGKPRP